MARTGKFGRLPRAAPNIGSVIAALAREMAAQRDRNILEAWKSGGLVDGEPVTDSDLIRHFEERRDGISPDDPMWDYYNNLALTYGFSIEESKMTLQYADGTASDSDMSAFYRTWAGKIPKDTELYRTLMRSAAEYLDRSRQRAAAGAASARANAYAAADTAAYDEFEADFDQIYGLLNEAAHREGILVGTETLSDLRLADQNDHSRFLALFEKIGDRNNAYLDPIRIALEAAGYGGLNYGMWLDLSNQKQHGLDARTGLARQYGYNDRAGELGDASHAFNLDRTLWRDVDDLSGYDTARDHLNDTLTDASADPWAVDRALDDYAKQVNLTRDRSENQDDIGLLNNELIALSGNAPEEGYGPTVWEPGKGSVDDAQSTAETRAWTTIFTDTVASGMGVGTQIMESKQDGSQVAVWKLLPVSDAALRDPSRGTVTYQKMGDGTSQPVYVQHHDIRVTAKGGYGVSGAAQTDLTATGDDRIGFYWTVGQGNTQVTFYGIYTEQGVRYLNYNPFSAPPDFTPDAQGRGAKIEFAQGEQGVDGLSDMVIELSLPSAAGGSFNPQLVIPSKELTDELNANNPGWALTQRGIEMTHEPTRLAFLGANKTSEYNRIRNTWADNPVQAATEIAAYENDYNTAANLQNMAIRARPMKIGGVQEYADQESPFLPIGLSRRQPGIDEQDITFEQKLAMRFGPEQARAMQERALLTRASTMADEVLARQPAMAGARGAPGPGQLGYEAYVAYMKSAGRPTDLPGLRTWLGERIGEERVAAALPPIRLPSLPGARPGQPPSTYAQAREGGVAPPPAAPLPPIRVAPTPTPPPPLPPVHPVDLGEPKPPVYKPPQKIGGHQQY